MLVLSRRDQETVVIDGNIKITIIRITGNSVRLGIEAPSHVAVNRGEVQQRIDAEAGHPARSNQARLLQQRLARGPAVVPPLPAPLNGTNGSDAA